MGDKANSSAKPLTTSVCCLYTDIKMSSSYMLPSAQCMRLI